ncbi:MAG: hypothetical protein UU76_C0014G0008 [Parcubacteria group bacterium GW2011_GWC1_41_7]|nr:MAG: hypothetical protein UU76_C0014G0008 [Parcubacteria group bacterium GW2011_GWC1_41_7]
MVDTKDSEIIYESMEQTPEYQEVLEATVKALVNHPSDVVVQRTLDEMGVLIRVKVNPQDMGLIIGRKGDIVRSLRTIVKMIGLKHHARVNLKVEEPSLLDRNRSTSDKIISDLKVEN